MKGIDVSYAQGSIDWQAVKDFGIEFAIIRVGYGESKNDSGGELDSNAIFNIKNAIAVGLKVGLYIYSYAVNTDEAKKEAEFTLSIAKQFDYDFPVGLFIDLEDSKYQGSLDINPFADVFCQTVQAAGYKPGYYCNLNWYNSKINQTIKDKWSLFWLAQYNDVASVSSSIWQYSSSESVPGITGNVDMNESSTNFETLKTDSPLPFKPIDPSENMPSTVDIGVEYETFISGYGWTKTSRNGFSSGSIGQSKAFSIIKIRPINLNGKDAQIHYQVFQNNEWSEFKVNGQECGIEGYPIEAIQIGLRGADADQYEIHFRLHCQNEGTLDWAIGDEKAGTIGANYRAEAFSAMITGKGVDLGLNDSESFKNLTVVTKQEEIQTILNIPAVVDTTDIFGEYFVQEEFADDCYFEGYRGYSISNPCDGFYRTSYGKEANLNPLFYPLLNKFRKRVKSGVVITCGVRCPSDNAAVGGVSNSLHLLGDAVDCYVIGMDILEAAKIMWNEFGVAVRVYPASGFMHVEMNSSLKGIYNQEEGYFMAA